MARPLRDPNARPRREDILDHATRLFAERGYEGTSMGDLAEVVGMRKASLFYHFASKDELYTAVLDRLVTAVAASVAAVAADAGSFADRLDTLSDAVTSALVGQPFAGRLILREAMDWGPVIRGGLGDRIQAVMGATEEFIRAGQAAGAFVAIDAKQLIVTIMGIHLIPFGVERIVERFAGVDPFSAPFADARRAAVREHVRRLLLAAPAK